uniref:Uncharacterized protein n=1 Tax=Acrobeloides nanus TaxID=290746 RepID=A0A914E675_9BILA
MGTQIAAQTMNSNRELLSKPGRPEVRPVDLNASPSDIFSQGLTNLLEPARQNFMKSLPTINGQGTGPPQESARAAGVQSVQAPSSEIPQEFQGASSLFRSPSASSYRGDTQAQGGAEIPQEFQGVSSLFRSPSVSSYRGDTQSQGGSSSLFQLANSLLRGSTAAMNPRGETYGANSERPRNVLPNIQQLVPGANENFGFRMGEGCLPFIGEFMRAAYGNCVRDADKRTWDVWGKEFTNVLTSGKIDLLAASKETCRRGAEREQCGQLRKAVSDCDIIGSIQIGMNMQRSFQRCDEITGILDQNPRTMMNQMSGLINGEMAQGFLNNFLG